MVNSHGVSIEAPFTTAGFRPDIDGAWLISRVTHRVDVAGGYVCDIEAEKPNSGTEPDVEIG